MGSYLRGSFLLSLEKARMDLLATHVQKKNILNDRSPLDLSSGASTWRLPFFTQPRPVGILPFARLYFFPPLCPSERDP